MNDDMIVSALLLMREAITMLDDARATTAACYLQMAIDAAEGSLTPSDASSAQ